MVLSLDEQTIFSGSMRGLIKMWDIETGRLKYSKEAQSGSITSLAVSPDGKLLASGSREHKIKLWNIRKEKITKKQIFPKKQSGAIIFLAFNFDGNTLYSGSPFHSVQIWNCETKTNQSFQGDKWAIRACTISSDQRTLVTGKHIINVRDTITGTIKYTLNSRTETSVIAINAEQNLIATTDEHNRSNSSINIWNLNTRNTEKTLYGHTNYVKSLVFSPDGKTLISGSQDNTIKMWDIKTGSLITTLEGHTSTVTSLIVTQDGQRIISGSSDCSIRIWGIE